VEKISDAIIDVTLVKSGQTLSSCREERPLIFAVNEDKCTYMYRDDINRGSRLRDEGVCFSMEAMSLDGWMKGKKDKKRVQKERRRQILFNANIPSYDASWLILFYGE
jgi:predicted transcriptional regulator